MFIYISTKDVDFLLETLLKKNKNKYSKNKYSFTLKDEKLLNSATHATKNSYYKTIEDLAASYLNSFVHNHPFIDGNKRFAWLVCECFLKLNGYSLENTKADFWGIKIERFADHKLDTKDMARLLKENLIKVENT